MVRSEEKGLRIPKSEVVMLQKMRKFFDIDNPIDLMNCQRMAKIWQRILECEDNLDNHGLVKCYDSNGVEKVYVNPASYLMLQLDSQFQKYYRLLKQKKGKVGDNPSLSDLFGDDGED